MATVGTQHIEKYAAESKFTRDELEECAGELHDAVQENLHRHFRSCRLSSGEDYWILERKEGVWLALTIHDINEELRRTDRDVEAEMLRLIANASLDDFQDRDLTIAVPGTVARRLKEPLYYPIYVRFPEGWQQGEYFVFQRFQELVWRYEMSPAEALDYWATEHMNTTPEEWAGKRDVSPEAVRKNVRQAREQLSDDEMGATHQNGNIRAVSLDEVPDDGPHDEDTDLFYVPSLEDAERWDEEDL